MGAGDWSKRSSSEKTKLKHEQPEMPDSMLALEEQGYITTLGSKRMREGESGLLALQSDTFWLGVAQGSSLLWALYPTCLVRRREVVLYSTKNSG